MAVDFRCEHCGKLLSVDAAADSQVACPHCQKTTTVPAALASMPRPMVPGGSGQAPPPLPAPSPGGQATAAQEDEVLEEGELEESPVMRGMATAMPWVISLFFHIGLGLVMFLVTMITIRSNKVDPNKVIVPDAFLSADAGGAVDPSQDDPTQTDQMQQTEERMTSNRETTINADSGQTDKAIELIGATGSSSAGLAAMGMSSSSGGPKSDFMGLGGNAYNVVWVIDCSGSMRVIWDEVRAEMLRSIGRLVPEQNFHVILFAAGEPMERTPKMLTPADEANKIRAAEFLADVRPINQTDPLPALTRAFAVLNNQAATGGKEGKLIYLLTDGEFPDNKKVLDMVAAANRSKEVKINTILYGFRGPEAMKAMRQLAEDNGGSFATRGGGE